MDKITFKEFYDSLSRQQQRTLAFAAMTTPAYLYQIAAGIRNPGMRVASRLKAADSRITDSMLRPDLYA